MKKVMKSMVVGSLAAAMLASGASAANFTSSADVLKDLGLFQGSEAGYDLDRAPDRAEAATMMVRLLGKEAEAKSFWQGMTNPQPAPQIEAASAYTLLDNELGVAMQGNTLYVADKDKVLAKAAEEGMLQDFDYEGYTKMMWAPIGVTIPEGAVMATFSYDGMEGEPIEIDLTKTGDAVMMHAEDGKLMYYVGIAAEKDGKIDLWPEETIAAKHFVWLDQNGTVIGETDAALNWSHTAPTAETTTEAAKPVEESTAAKDYVFPFTDMDNGYEWAKPYVAWLYNEGLTAGASATTFEPGSKCTAQQYTTFLMRALGYSDAAGGDFTYDKVIDFATEKGVVDMFNMDADDFMRDDLVAMSYTALSVAPKSGETDLLTKLVSEEAVDADKAAPVQKTFEALRNFNEAYKAVAATTSADATADFTMNMKVEDLSVDASGKFSVQVKADPAKLEEMQMALTGAITVNLPTEDGKTEKMEVPMEMYVKDGVAYTNAMGAKMKQDLDLETALKGFDMQQMMGMTTMPLCMVDSISQDGNTYKMSYNTEAFNGLFTELFSQMTTQVELTEEMKAQGLTEEMFKLALDLTKADIEVTFKNGGLYDEKADMAMTMEMLGLKADVTMQMNMSAKKVGDAVTVAYPADLDTYKTVEEMMADLETATEVATPETGAEVVTTETAEAQEVVKQPATEYTFALTEGETKVVSNLIFDKDVTVSGNNAQINFVNCEFKGNVVNTASEYTRVVLEGGSTVAGQCVLQNDVKEATLESAFPKFLTDAPINVVCKDCIGSVIALGDFDVVFNGKTYKLQDATLYFDVKNPDAGFVPYKDQQANNFCVAQWWENGEQQLIVECEYDANL